MSTNLALNCAPSFHTKQTSFEPKRLLTATVLRTDAIEDRTVCKPTTAG